MLDLEIIKILLFKSDEEIDQALIDKFIREYAMNLIEILSEALTYQEESNPEVKKLMEDIDIVMDFESESDEADINAPLRILQMILVTVNSNKDLNEMVNKMILDFDRSLIEEYSTQMDEDQKIRLSDYFEDLDTAIKNAGVSLGIHLLKEYNIVGDISSALELIDDSEENSTTNFKSGESS